MYQVVGSTSPILERRYPYDIGHRETALLDNPTDTVSRHAEDVSGTNFNARKTKTSRDYHPILGHVALVRST